MAKNIFNGIDIHLSTQANTTNYETVKFFRDIGVKRVVLARELSLDEIKKAAEEAGLLFVDAFDADDDGEIVEQTARMLVVLQEHGKAQ